MRLVAIDVGGTKLAAAVVQDGQILIRSQRPTPAADVDAMWQALIDVMSDCGISEADAGGFDAIGVGCGGPMTIGGETVSPLNIPAWRAFPLRRRLADLLGVVAFVDNDAKALALAEHRWGVGAGVQNFLAMVVSTGVGGGIILDGRLLHGHAGNAGHIGHVIVEPDGRQCPCGARGCLEAEASGTALRSITGDDPAKAPIEVIERTGKLVGRAVASVANLLDLQLTACAGSVALGFGAPFFEAAQAEIDRCARLGFSRGTRIIPAGLGADGPLLGAAAVGLVGLEAAK